LSFLKIILNLNRLSAFLTLKNFSIPTFTPVAKYVRKLSLTMIQA